MNGQVPAMAQAAIAADLDQPLNVHLDFPPQIAFHLEALGDVFTEEGSVCFGKVFHPNGGVYSGPSNNPARPGRANTVNVLETNVYPLITRKVNTFNSCHVLLSLSLFVLWVVADDVQSAVALHDFAFRTALANGW
jgi:hypothetical protein